METMKKRFDRIFKQGLGLSDKSIAFRMEISKGHFSGVKNQRYNATDAFWRKLHKVFPQVDVNYLRYGGETDNPISSQQNNLIDNTNLVDINKRLIHLDDTHQDIKKEIYTLQDMISKIDKKIDDL